MWQELRKFKGTEDPTVPMKIIHENKEVASPEKMAKIFNKFYIDKVKEIEEGFTEVDESPVDLLTQLINKPETRFKF